MEGILISRGRGIRSHNSIQNAHIQDIAPTLLYILDESVPSDMDGRVLTGMFTSEYLNAHPVRYIDMDSGSDRHTGDGLDGDDQEKMKKTLIDLGYL